jgi:ribosomal protein L11 methyltransferase
MELWIAKFSEIQFLGIEERPTELVISMEKDNPDIEMVLQQLKMSETAFSLETLEPTNWNAHWESQFEPIVIPNPIDESPMLYIRAHFHPLRPEIPKEICITPKMSFGTGHHATTLQMIQMMSQLSFQGKTVLDFGTGTGILAIYAEMLGAFQIVAIDYDPWCIENTRENLHTNDCKKITVSQADHCPDLNEPVDIILANINLNVIQDNLNAILKSIKIGGKVLFSGVLEHDKDLLHSSILQTGLQITEVKSLNQWLVVCAERK